MDSRLELFQRLNQVLGIGESVARFMLGVNQFPIGPNIEDASSAFDQLGADPHLFLDLLRKTCGFGQIVSHRAVFDRYVHCHSSGKDDRGSKATGVTLSFPTELVGAEIG